MKVEIQWDDTPPPEAIDFAQQELARMMTEDGLGKPEDLIFATLLMTDDMDGPSVFVWGKEGDPFFHAKYQAVTVWRDISPEEFE